MARKAKEKLKGHPRFYELIEEIKLIHSRKSHDYAGQDPLSNFRLIKGMGLAPWKGVLVRISDKFSRLLQFAKKGRTEVKDETVVDTLKDLSIYSLLCIILYEEDALHRKKSKAKT